VRATNSAGTTASSGEIRVRYVPPPLEVIITNPPAMAFAGEGGTFVIVASVEVTGTVSDRTVTEATLILDGTDRTIIPVDNGYFEHELTLEKEGLNTIRVEAADAQGNTASSGVVGIVFEATAPNISAQLSEPGETVLITIYSDEALSSPPTVEVTGGSSTEVEVALTGVREWTGSYEIPEDGSYIVEVSGTDEAGNMGSCTTSFNRESVSAAAGDTITVVSKRLTVDIVVGEEVKDQSVSTVLHYQDPRLGRTTEVAIFVRVKAGVALRWAIRRITIKAFYNPAELPGDMNETTLKLYLWTPSKGGWVLVKGATVDPIEHSITGSVTY